MNLLRHYSSANRSCRGVAEAAEKALRLEALKLLRSAEVTEEGAQVAEGAEAATDSR